MKKHFIFYAVVILLLCNCSKDDNPMIKKEIISGFVQKGPFINGTSITINELENNLSQTGKSYNTQIVNNQGSFELHNVELVSNSVSIRADGFYYNEITGGQSASQITLYALSDISDKSTVNVNILSHLEKARVEYLISQGTNFSDAKIRAQSEVLKIFSYDISGIQSSELLDISINEEENGVLLATSLILQGFRTEGELTELLSNISSDLKEDGILNNDNLGSQMINHAMYLDTNSIRDNLEKRYSEIGIEASIPNFEKYINRFIDSTNYKITKSLIEYPENGLYGQNILDLTRTKYTGGDFSLAANLAKGTKLKIKITALGGGVWYYETNSPKNWSITYFDFATKSQYFTSMESGESCDLWMSFDSGDYLIEYYEMDSTEPTKTKTITK